MQWRRWENRGRIYLQLNLANNNFAIRPDEIALMGEWCTENQVGRRTSYSNFEFKHESDVTSFLLRWG